MHLFRLATLLYLSFHAIAYVLLFISIMGIPGQPDESKSISKWFLNLYNIFLIISWKGLSVLAIGAVVSFFFHYDTLGKVLCWISLGLGICLFLTLVGYYMSVPKS